MISGGETIFFSSSVAEAICDFRRRWMRDEVEDLGGRFAIQKMKGRWRDGVADTVAGGAKTKSRRAQPRCRRSPRIWRNLVL